MSGLGEFMKAARRRVTMPDGRRMSQEDLAEVTGLSSGTIGQIENGRTQRPERETMEKIAAALRVTYNDLAIAADMADPPDTRDLITEVRAIGAIRGVDAKLDALKQLSPDLAQFYVDLLIEDLEARRSGLARQTMQPAQANRKRDHAALPTVDPLDW